jgi:hypothetical protein
MLGDIPQMHAFCTPKQKWNSWLSLAEWWYNSSFHTSLKMNPFQVLYGFPPPQVEEMFLADDNVEDATTMLQRRQEANESSSTTCSKLKNEWFTLQTRTEANESLQLGTWSI